MAPKCAASRATTLAWPLPSLPAGEGAVSVVTVASAMTLSYQARLFSPSTREYPVARIVMKFGGTSMAGIERIRSVAARVKREAAAGNEVAVVVSAMAGETDRLVNFCREASALYDPK